jgi:hypothetical protein
MRLLGAVVGGLVCFVAFGAAHVHGQVESSGAIQTDEPANEGSPAAASVLTCVQSILEQRGEAILQQDAQPGLLTWPHMVNGDELARLAILSGPDRAAWSEGTYQIQVTLTPDEDGRVRLGIEARIVGRHDVSAPLLRLSPWERLDSSGVLEQEVGAALTACPNVTDPSPANPTDPPGSLAGELGG